MSMYLKLEDAFRALLRRNYGNVTGATDSNDGVIGTVPQPKPGEQDCILCGDGTWKKKLDQIVYQNGQFYIKNKSDVYTISYTLNGGTANNPTTYISDDSVPISDATKSGSIFLGWSGSNGTNPQKGLTIPKGSTGNKSYTANWDETHTITYILGVNDGTTLSNTSYTTSSNTVTIASVNRVNDLYTLLGWATSSGGDIIYRPNQTITVPDDWKTTKNVNLYAIWEKSGLQYTGSVQTWTVPADGTYKFQCWGAQGGGELDLTHDSHGGSGGYAEGTKTLTKGTVLYVFIGGRGKAAPLGSTKYSASAVGGGGWNGGGHGHSGNDAQGFGGGGMTHISTTNNPVLHNSDWNPSGTLIVAAGGGGADNPPTGYQTMPDGTKKKSELGGYDDGSGGAGGGLQGSAGLLNGQRLSTKVATQTDGYKRGQGEDVNYQLASDDSGGGGGGWYGGRVDYTSTNSGGAGGSSWIGGVDNGLTISGDNVMPLPDDYFNKIPSNERTAGRSGDGFVRITLVR